MEYEATSTSRPVKRTRVNRACNFCRKKKIKCDIDQRVPCSSCIQYRCECTSTDSPKKRPPPKGYIESLEIRLQQMEKLLQKKLLQDNGNNNSATTFNISSDSDSDHYEYQDNNSPPMDLHSTKVIRHIGISSPYYSMGKQKQEEESRSENTGKSKRLYADLVGDDNKHEQSQVTVSTTQGQLHLVYDDDTNDLMVIHDCSPLHKSIKQKTRIYGSGIGLDDIIPPSLVKSLVQKFIKLRPALLPMIGTRSILEAIQTRPSNPLLVSSICSYVAMFLPKSDQTFDKYGIDRKDLIRKLGVKEDELLRTAFLDPTISNIQAIIILCCHPSHPAIYNGIWLRAGIAIRMSQDLGLHRSLTNASNSKKVRELGNLLWHCVYILDRWSCAVLGRPLAIVDSDCNVDLPEYDGDDEQDHTLFIAFIKLSGILGEIQRRIYSPKAKASLGISGTSTTSTVNSLQRLLFEWYDQLPMESRLTENDMARLSSPSTTQEEKDTLLKTKQWQLVAPLMIAYYAVTILLHRPFIISDNETLFSPTSAKRCMESATMAIDIAQLMDMLSFPQFCWNILIFSLSVAVSIHLYNCSSDQPDVCQTARHYLRIVIEMWDTLDEKYPFAPKLVSVSPLQFAVSLLGLQEVVSSTRDASKPSSSTNDFTTNDASTTESDDQHFQLDEESQPVPFQFQPTDPVTAVPIPLTNFNAEETTENQLPNQDSWQQFFLNNTGPSAFGLTGTQNGDDLWQTLPLF